MGDKVEKPLALEQSKITAKPVKYIVPGIYDRDTKKGKFIANGNVNLIEL